MTYEIYRLIFTGALLLCGIMFVISILLFWLMHVPAIIGDLSGATAKKAIKNIREQNESGNGRQKTKDVKQKRSKRKSKKTLSENQKNHIQGMPNARAVTEKINTQKLARENETTVLAGGQETTVLEGMNVTTVLYQASPVGKMNAAETGKRQDLFTIEYEITFLHSDELVGWEESI